MKIEKQENGNIVRFYAENSGDSEYLSAIIEYTGRLNKRVSDAQCKMHESIAKMHEANLELVKMKTLDSICKNFDKVQRSWAYRILNFISLR